MEMKPRPPYVTFETRAVEDRSKSIELGRPAYKDVDFAFITPMGSKDRIELIVHEWFKMLETEVKDGRFEQTWLSGYQAAYEAWKKGLEIPLEGTALRDWPGLSPAIMRTLQDVGIRTVEDVAGMNEEAVGAVGMGARALKQRANDWLMNSKEVGKASEQMSALRSENENLKVTLETLQKEVAKLKVDKK